MGVVQNVYSIKTKGRNTGNLKTVNRRGREGMKDRDGRKGRLTKTSKYEETIQKPIIL